MSKPVQVQKQVERVNELMRELGGQETANPDNAATVPPPPPPPAPETPQVQQNELDLLQQRYRTLQGMYNADTTRLRTQAMEAQAKVQTLEARIAALEAQQVQQPTNPPPAVKFVTEKDEEEYGDTLDMMRRAAREEATNLFAEREKSYMDRIAHLESQLGSVTSTVVPEVETIKRSREQEIKDSFWQQINEQVPNWREINVDEGWKAWLLEVDQLTGRDRQFFLSEARNEYNAARVIRFFKDFEQFKATSAPAQNGSGTPSELELMASPGASRGVGAPQQPTPKKWTRAEISTFFADVSKGAYRGREEEKGRIEADIFAAQREGRVT